MVTSGLEPLEPLVDTPHPLTSWMNRRSRRRGPSVRGWIRDRSTTTPGRLVLISILVVAGAVAFGVIATLAERSRAQAAHAVRHQTEPLLVQAATLYSALSDANATVTTTFLQGGLEPPARRLRYLGDLRMASASLSTLTQEVSGSAGAQNAVATISAQLPVYSGLVEAARANNRQGFPIGAAYLRQASSLLTGAMLPQADRLYTVEARRLDQNYGTGTSSSALIVVIVIAVAAIASLLIAQVYLASASRRILNVPVVIGTLVLAAASIWAIAGMTSEQSSLAAARRASDSVAVVAATRVLLARAQGDESLALVNRGSDASDAADFAAVMPTLARLIDEVSGLEKAAGNRAAASQIASEFASYRAQSSQINDLENSGQITGAIQFAASTATTPEHLSNDLSSLVAHGQRGFVRSGDDATSALSGLWLAIPLITALAAAAALIGLRHRINEYR